jgi:hypothetical protein
MVLGVVGLCRGRPERAYFALEGCERWGCSRVASELSKVLIFIKAKTDSPCFSTDGVASAGVHFSDGRGSGEA